MLAGQSVPVSRDIIDGLDRLIRDADWRELATRAAEEVIEHPNDAVLYGYVAYGNLNLQKLEDGYAWAVRGAAVDRQHPFVMSCLSSLANLTGRRAEAYDAACSVVESRGDAQSIVSTIAAGILAAAKLDRIAHAVEQFTPAILRLDHDDLHYSSACLYALARDDRAYTYIAKALAAGKPRTAFDDADFTAVRDDPRFAELMARDWAAERAALARSSKHTRAELRPEDFIDVAVAQRGNPSGRRHPELERAIEAHTDDVEGYRIYSDWLQEQDDPLGLFVRASERCAAATTETERMLAFVDWANMLHRNAGRWLGAFVEYLEGNSRAVWQHGFVRELVFDVGYSRRTTIDAARLLETTLALPMFRFVHTLSIGDVPTDDNEIRYDDVAEALLRVAPPCLRALEIGPNQFQVSWPHLDGRGLAERIPLLESLVLGGGDITTATLDFPNLRRFAIQTSGLTNANLEAICAARWPVLEDLEIWFGRTERGAAVLTGHELAPILSGRTLPKLRRLALMNAEFTDAICDMLARAPIVARLTELDLSKGTMSDAGAATLVAAASRFRHLTKLVIDENDVSPSAADALVRVLPNVQLGTQRADEYYDVVDE